MKYLNISPCTAILPRTFTTAALLLCCTAALTVPSQALAGGLGPPGQAGDGVTQVIPPDSSYFGKQYADLTMAWWDWSLNQPPETNPILDETGEFCHVGQDEDFGQGKKIFFLAGNFGGETERHCTIPSGKALFFPVVNGLWIAPEECATADECRQTVNDFLGFPAEIECTIDGVPVEDIRAYRAQSPPGGSPLHIRSGGLLEWLAPDFYVPRDYEPGSVADGYWLLVRLGDGAEHVIEFSATSGNTNAPFELSVTYFLTVEEDDDD